MPWSLPWAYPEFARQEFNRAARMLVPLDRKSTRLNSSHLVISYAVFCLKKKKPPNMPISIHLFLTPRQIPPAHRLQLLSFRHREDQTANTATRTTLTHAVYGTTSTSPT